MSLVLGFILSLLSRQLMSGLMNLTGEQLEEAQLLADGYAQPVALLMQAAVKADMEAEDPELVQLVEMDSVVPNGNFSVGDNGVQWIFQPYEVGPYALGIVTALVSWEELKPYLK